MPMAGKRRATKENRQLRAATAIASGMTRAEAAEHCGMNVTTVYRWLKKPEFVALIEELQGLQIDKARSSLEAAAAIAANTVVELSSNASISPAVRLKAALAILDRIGLVAVSKTQNEHTGAGGTPLVPSQASVTDLLDKLAKTSPQMLEAALKGAREPGD